MHHAKKLGISRYVCTLPEAKQNSSRSVPDLVGEGGGGGGRRTEEREGRERQRVGKAEGEREKRERGEMRME